jgi:hypothetical protein
MKKHETLAEQQARIKASEATMKATMTKAYDRKYSNGPSIAAIYRAF